MKKLIFFVTILFLIVLITGCTIGGITTQNAKTVFVPKGDYTIDISW